MGEWITWSEASEQTGLPVPTIDYATRLGRIKHRPHHGPRPTLDRDSVLEWATWYSAERAAIQARRGKRSEQAVKVRTYEPHPDAANWLTAHEAAERLSVTVSTIARMVRKGNLAGQSGARLFVSVESVEAHLEDEAKWCTHVQAAALIGCTRHDVARLVESGELPHRVTAKCKPSVDKAAAIAFRPIWKERKRARVSAAREHAKAKRSPNAPPDDGDVWLDTRTTALVLGMSPSGVRLRVERGTLPAVNTGTRLWFRRRDVEIASSVRSLGWQR